MFAIFPTTTLPLCERVCNKWYQKKTTDSSFSLVLMFLDKGLPTVMPGNMETTLPQQLGVTLKRVMQQNKARKRKEKKKRFLKRESLVLDF